MNWIKNGFSLHWRELKWFMIKNWLVNIGESFEIVGLISLMDILNELNGKLIRLIKCLRRENVLGYVWSKEIF